MTYTFIKVILLIILVFLAVIGIFALLAIATIYRDEIERQSNNNSNL